MAYLFSYKLSRKRKLFFSDLSKFSYEKISLDKLVKKYTIDSYFAKCCIFVRRILSKIKKKLRSIFF